MTDPARQRAAPAAPQRAAPPPAAPLGPVATAGGFALVLLLTVLLAVWGAFLVPFRIGATLVPLCWVIALVGNVALGHAGGRLAGRTGAVLPALLWMLIALMFFSRRTEGDVVVPPTLTGLVFLVAGAVGGAVSYNLFLARR